MHTENPLLEILLTRSDAKALLATNPSGTQRTRLLSKIAACDLALNFLRANSESANQMLTRIPAESSSRFGSASHIA